MCRRPPPPPIHSSYQHLSVCARVCVRAHNSSGVQSSCIVVPGNVTICPTSFPNPVNFGMTFNKSLFYDLGAVIGVETRALWLAG